MFRTALALAVAAVSTAASAQPAPQQPPPPQPQPQPAQRRAPAPAMAPTGTKPAPLYLGECDGELVYISSREYRECCLLCSVGADSMSKLEIAEAEAAAKERAEAERNHTTVNIDARQYSMPHFTAFGRIGDHNEPESAPAAEEGGRKGNERREAKPEHRDRGPARTAYGGFKGLSAPKL
jgi:hypothetical protein